MQCKQKQYLDVMSKALFKLTIILALSIMCLSHLGEGKIIILLCEIPLLYYLLQIMFESTFSNEFTCGDVFYSVYGNGYTKDRHWLNSAKDYISIFDKEDYNELATKIKTREKKTISIKIIEKKTKVEPKK